MNLYNPQQEDINYLKKLLADGSITQGQLSGMQINGSFDSPPPPNPVSEQTNALMEYLQPKTYDDTYIKGQGYALDRQREAESQKLAEYYASSNGGMNALAQTVQPPQAEAGMNQWDKVPRGTGVMQRTNEDGTQSAPIQFGQSQAPQLPERDVTRNKVDLGRYGSGYYGKDGQVYLNNGQPFVTDEQRQANAQNQMAMEDRQLKNDKTKGDTEHVQGETDLNAEKLLQLKAPAPDGPGGAGSEILSDPQTGIKYSVNVQNGNAYRSDESGAWVPVNINSIPNNAQKLGSGQGGSGREMVQTGRVMLAARQASKDLSNIVELPLASSSGWFGGREQGKGILDATKEQLANVMTGQDAQSYNVMITGVQRQLAAIEAAGLMPSGALTKQMDAIVIKEGDTELTKLHKLAQIRQITEQGVQHVLDNPRVSNQEKDAMKGVRDELTSSVPYTQKDLIKLQKLQQVDPRTKLRDVIGGSAAPQEAGGKTELDSMPMARSYTGKLLTAPDGTKYKSDGDKWVRQYGR